MIRIHSVLAPFFSFFWGKNPQRKVKWITLLGEPIKAANLMCLWNRGIHDKKGAFGWVNLFLHLLLLLASFIHELFFLLHVIMHVNLRRSISSSLGKVPDSELITKLIQDLHRVPEAPEIVCVCVCVCVLLSRVRLFVTHYGMVGHHGIFQARKLEWVGIPFSRRIFPTQAWNPGLLHCRQILYHLSHQGSTWNDIVFIWNQGYWWTGLIIILLTIFPPLHILSLIYFITGTLCLSLPFT